MYLKSLELQGFKSFPDKTLIRFGDDITAIVGPNGSGKSNISDAILWVMGEQSSKTLRGAKMEDVIFGGTQKRSAVGFAEATLTLDNSDRALAYDADEVMVTRRYYRSGDSEFYINKQSARLRDINELFMDTGLGKEGYSNIGQGRIDEILALKSGDRREVFEEAAGISKYRHRKEETERKLEKTQDNLLRIGDKVSELEMQLEPLKIQSEKAKKYLELKDELKGVEVAVWLDTLERLSAAAKKAEEDYTSASFVLQQAHDDLDSLYRQAESLTQTLHNRDGELETVRVKANMLSATHQQLEGQLAVLRGNVENNNANIARIEEELQGQDDRSGGVCTQIQQTRQRIAQIDEDLQDKHRQLEALQQELADMTANAQGITKQFLQLRGQESTLSADLAGCQADVRGLEESMCQTRQRLEQLEQDLASGQFLQLRGQESTLSADLAGCQADVRGLEESMCQTRQRLEQLEQDLASGESRRHEAQTNLDGANRELNQAKEAVTAAENTISGYALRQSTRQKRRDELQENLRHLVQTLDSVSAKARVFRAMERDFESYNKAVRMVMQEVQRGGLRHVHGPVSRLIRTQDQCTVAIEIALGASLQHIVVVRMVMQEVQRGGLRHVHGPVSRLIRTQDQCTVAIEIALGASLQHIVVDTEADGKAGIQYLKRTNGGRTTFLPLNSIRGRSLRETGLETCRGFVGIASQLVTTEDRYLKRTNGGRTTFLPLNSIRGRSLRETGLETCRGFVGIASQLVTTEDRYREVVEDLLGRTVIVQDMDAAIAMAQKYSRRFKIVTLDGQVMNPGGSMTGGSVNRDAGILSKANELEKLTAQEKKMQQDKLELEAQLQEAQRQWDQVEFQLTAARDQLRSAEDQVLRLQGQQKQYEVLVQAIAEAQAAAQRERDALKDRDAADQNRYAAQQAKIQVFTRQLAQVKQSLTELDGSQSQAAQATTDMTERLTQLKAGTAALEAERTTAQAHIADLEGLRGAMEGDRAKKLALIDTIREDTARQEEQIADVSRQQAENRQQSEQIRRDLEKTDRHHPGGHRPAGGADCRRKPPAGGKPAAERANPPGFGKDHGGPGGGRSCQNPHGAGGSGEKQGHPQHGAGLRPAGTEEGHLRHGGAADHRQAVGFLRNPHGAGGSGEKQGHPQHGAGLRPAGTEEGHLRHGGAADHRQAVGFLRTDPRHRTGAPGRDRKCHRRQPPGRRVEAENCRPGHPQPGCH